MEKKSVWIIIAIIFILILAFIAYSVFFKGASSDDSVLASLGIGKCKDTCASQGFNCGTQTICKKSVNCGSCQSGYTCTAGKCVCTPNCAGKNCGSNGCGGSCGTCQTGYYCSAGICLIIPTNNTNGSLSSMGVGKCVDTCSSLGYNCGTWTICKKSVNCGTCQTGYTCSAGKCVCTPNCTGKVCGSNGCGGSCGTCQTGYYCSVGSCLIIPTNGTNQS